MNIKRAAVAASLAAPLVIGFAGSASAGRTWASVQTTGDHGNGNPCPEDDRIPVYAQNGNPNGHFICSTVKGIKGDTGDTGPQGEPGKDGVSNVPGPQGPKGDTGPQGEPGKDGADSTVPGPQGPAGPVGAVGPAGESVVLDDAGDHCPLGGISVTVGETTGYVCHGLTGPAGAAGAVGPVGSAGSEGPKGDRGPAGEDGKDGLSKTVLVHADGTQEVVPNLPGTGGDESTWVLGAVGAGLLVTGGTAMWVYRRRNQ